MLVGHRKDFTVELLDDQADDEIFCVIFLRHDEEDGAFLRTELLGIDCRVKAQYLLQLGIQKSVEPGERRGEDALHGLLRRVERCPREPLCLMLVRQMGKEQLKQSPALDAAGCQQILYELEHRHDVSLLRLTVFGYKQNYGGQQALSGIVEEGVLTGHRRIEASGGDDCLGGDLGVLLRSGLIRKVLRVFQIRVHIPVDQMEQIVAITGTGASEWKRAAWYIP